ncbi:MAG: NF038129 family PEP-CTERM protein [Bryobacteraceae bacterium]
MKQALLLLLALGAAGALQADVIYNVNLQTAGIPAGSYFLDFQLISADDAAPNANNTVTIDFLTLGGGAFLAPPPVLNGGTTGNTAAGFTFTDSAFFNAALIAISPGTDISFRMTYSTNFTSGFPDEFSYAVLDSSMNSIVSTGVGASMVVDITGVNATPVVHAADPAFGGIIPTLTMVPEPATWLAGLPLLAGVLLRRRKRVPHS